MPKSTENTVFVRFVPTPSQQVMRHQLEDIFSHIGPIKKSSWIHSQENKASKGYGFVRYVSYDDAQAATADLNNNKIQMEGKEYTLKVELASLQPQLLVKNIKENTGPEHNISANQTTNDSDSKKKSRLILRNLSFYAKETHIRKVMERKYGPVLDVHLPRVQSNLHVGFCFVTFCNPKDAQKAVDERKVDIQKRAVTMDWSLPKKLHQQQQKSLRQESHENEKNPDELEQELRKSRGKSRVAPDENEDVSGMESSNSDGESKSDSESELDSDNEMASEAAAFDDSVRKRRSLFLRNLPFDTSRHDVFQLFSKFGFIESIYLVKDKVTGLLKGTAFVTYTQPESAASAIEKSSQFSDNLEQNDSTSFISQRQATTKSERTNIPSRKSSSYLLLRGRRIFVDFAVDKETAATFDSKEHNVPSADRRNMYLQAEARVESSSANLDAHDADTWDDLPEQDQKKRQSALKDKTAKLLSPIFFINPHRLSFRNMAKHVDETLLQQICERATKRGLEKGLVTAKDQIAHWRARGEMSIRDILALVQEKEMKAESIIPQWESKSNIKEYVPSVFIDRDFGPTRKKSNAPSRGFGFAEFKHHAHALACLRELNNNPTYSRDFVAGGKMADAMRKKSRIGKAKSSKGSTTGEYIGADGRVKIPRLIVDFAVSYAWYIAVLLLLRDS